jgi:O-acetyl-ADP-ribose deacetylase (regulator of RNase III)
MRYQEVQGNIITLALQKEFDVIAHGCNCHSKMGAGLAPQMAKAFGCDTFVMEAWGSSIQKLGCIDYNWFEIKDGKTEMIDDGIPNMVEKPLAVVNAYTQYNYGRNHSDGDLRPIDYEALTLCMRKMNKEFAGKHIGLPQIGAGLAGGNWNRIKNIIQTELTDCKVTVVIYNKLV